MQGLKHISAIESPESQSNGTLISEGSPKKGNSLLSKCSSLNQRSLRDSLYQDAGNNKLFVYIVIQTLIPYKSRLYISKIQNGREG